MTHHMTDRPVYGHWNKGAAFNGHALQLVLLGVLLQAKRQAWRCMSCPTLVLAAAFGLGLAFACSYSADACRKSSCAANLPSFGFHVSTLLAALI